MENFSPPDCPSCSAPGPEDYTNAEWLERWVDEGDEPVFTCAVCGRTALAGDWVGEFSLVVGAPGVTFNNWPELSEEFMKELKLRLGGRIAVVREHI